MNQISTSEKILVNLYASIDTVLIKIMKPFLPKDKLVEAERLFPDEINSNLYKFNIRSYIHLINKLNTHSFDEQFIKGYMSGPCGRLKLHVARHYGRITVNQIYSSKRD